MRFQKKSQVTLFLLLGLVVLFSVLLFIYFKATIEAREPEVISEEVIPIKRYVEECMHRSVEQAALIIGQQGGFIRIPPVVDVNPARYVSPDGLGVIRIPFWFYKGDRLSPSIQSVENEISRYVDENVRSCINNFTVFDDLYVIDEKSQPKVTAVLNDEDITVEMDYALDVLYKRGQARSTIERFQSKVPIRLRKIIDAANRLLDSELNSVFLENFTIDLMASNPNIPFTDMRFSCEIMTWNLNDIRQSVSDMLKVNLPRIRVKDTAHRPFMEQMKKYENLLKYSIEDIAEGNYPKDVPEDAYEFLHMYWDAGKMDDSLSIGIRSIGQDIDLAAKPSDNGLLRSRLVQGNKEFINILCINTYHFVYDVNFPVLVTIRDEISGGYLFNFAMPVTIVNNEAYKQNYGYDLFQASYFDQGFCDELGDDPVDIRAYGSEEGYSNMEIKDVNITLQCFKYYCPLGKTAADEGNYRLRTRIPDSCQNPILIAQKDGYLKTKTQVAVDDRIDIDMIKLNSLDLDIVYHDYNSYAESIGAEKPLEDDMEASIQLSSDDFYQYAMYPGNQEIELIEADTEYDIQIVLTLDGEYLGGYNGKVSLDASAYDDTIKFHAVKYVPTPYTKEDKLKMMSYLLDGDYVELLRPELG